MKKTNAITSNAELQATKNKLKLAERMLESGHPESGAIIKSISLYKQLISDYEQR